MKWLFSAFILLISSFSLAEKKLDLVFSYWDEAGAPFIIKNDSQGSLFGGIIPEIGGYVAQQLGVNIQYLNLPVQRIEPFLRSGQIHVDCITSPIWKETPDDYDWSPILFDGADRLLVNADQSSVLATFDDLKGKRLGVYNGYTYHPQIMHMIEARELDAVKVTDIDHGIKLLSLGRLDALIDFDILLNYKIRTHESESLALAELHADDFQLSCAYSKNLPVPKEALDRALQNLVVSGKMAEILNHYR